MPRIAGPERADPPAPPFAARITRLAIDAEDDNATLTVDVAFWRSEAAYRRNPRDPVAQETLIFPNLWPTRPGPPITDRRGRWRRADTGAWEDPTQYEPTPGQPPPREPPWERTLVPTDVAGHVRRTAIRYWRRWTDREGTDRALPADYRLRRQRTREDDPRGIITPELRRLAATLMTGGA